MELRDFCGFSKVADASKFTRFKQYFEPYLQSMFNLLVDYTEPICQAISHWSDPVFIQFRNYLKCDFDFSIIQNQKKSCLTYYTQ